MINEMAKFYLNLIKLSFEYYGWWMIPNILGFIGLIYLFYWLTLKRITTATNQVRNFKKV